MARKESKEKFFFCSVPILLHLKNPITSFFSSLNLKKKRLHKFEVEDRNFFLKEAIYLLNKLKNIDNNPLQLGAAL